MDWIMRIALLICLLSIFTNALKQKGKRRKYWLLFFTFIISLFCFLIFFGEHLNRNQFFGMGFTAALLVVFSGIAFLFGTYSIRNKIEPSQKWLLYLSIFGFALSFLHIPIWVLITGHFPPSAMNNKGALLATGLVLFSFFAPLIPKIIVWNKFRSSEKENCANKNPNQANATDASHS